MNLVPPIQARVRHARRPARTSAGQLRSTAHGCPRDGPLTSAARSRQPAPTRARPVAAEEAAPRAAAPPAQRGETAFQAMAAALCEQTAGLHLQASKHTNHNRSSLTESPPVRTRQRRMRVETSIPHLQLLLLLKGLFAPRHEGGCATQRTWKTCLYTPVKLDLKKSAAMTGKKANPARGQAPRPPGAILGQERTGGTGRGE